MNYKEISFRELLSSSIFTLQIHALTPPLCQEPNCVTRIPYPIASSREFRLHVFPVILPAYLLTTQHLPNLSHAPSAVTPIHNPSSPSTCVLSHFSPVQLFVTPWTVCSLPGSSVHGILQARTLEWAAISSSTHSTVTAFTILDPKCLIPSCHWAVSAGG